MQTDDLPRHPTSILSEHAFCYACDRQMKIDIRSRRCFSCRMRRGTILLAIIGASTLAAWGVLG